MIANNRDYDNVVDTIKIKNGIYFLVVHDTYHRRTQMDGIGWVKVSERGDWLCARRSCYTRVCKSSRKYGNDRER